MGLPAFNLLSLLALCVSLMLANSTEFYAGRYGGKRHILERGASQLVDFQLGSRYGRSDPELAGGPGGVAMITDNSKPEPERRFHANGRYGKRTPPPPPPPPLLPASLTSLLVPLPNDRLEEEEVIGLDGSFLCRYSGLANLYRCILRKDSAPEDSASAPSLAQDSSSLTITAAGTPVN